MVVVTYRLLSFGFILSLNGHFFGNSVYFDFICVHWLLLNNSASIYLRLDILPGRRELCVSRHLFVLYNFPFCFRAELFV